MFLVAFYDDEIAKTSKIAARQDIMVVVWHWHPRYFFFVSFQLLMDVFLFLAFYDDENAQTSENMVGQDMVVVWHPKYILLFVSFQLLMDVFMFLAFYDNEIV